MATARAHFHVAGTPVRVEPAFWLVVVLFGFGVREGWSLALWVAIVFVSILLHELGHATAYRVFGQRASIVLHGFAGLTFGQRGLGRWSSIAVSLAGPVSALALLGLPAKMLLEGSFGDDLLVDVVTGRTWDGWYLALDDLVFVNVYWSLVNLLPIRPLDGGNVLSELVGLRRARLVSMAVAVAAAAYAFTTDYRFAGFFAVLLGFMNYSEWRNAAHGTRARSGLEVDAPPASGSSRRGNELEMQGWNALRNGDMTLLRQILLSGGVELSAYLRGTAALRFGDSESGLALLADGLEAGEPPNLLVAATVAATGHELDLVAVLASHDAGEGMSRLRVHLEYGGHHRAAAVVGEALHSRGAPNPAQVAFETACAWARADDDDRAFLWLERAASEGFRSAKIVAGEPDLVSLRSDPRWTAVAAALGDSGSRR